MCTCEPKDREHTCALALVSPTVSMARVTMTIISNPKPKVTPTQPQANLAVHAQLLRERVQHLHRCLGHISKKRMAEVLRDNNFTNLTIQDLQLLTKCDACHTGKIRRSDRPRSKQAKRVNTKRPVRRKHDKQRALKPDAPCFGHTVCSDSTGKQANRTPGRKRYGNVMVDVHSRWTWLTLLKTLKNTFSKCTYKLLKRLAPATKIFRSDLGSEFNNGKTWQLRYERTRHQTRICLCRKAPPERNSRGGDTHPV